MRPIRAMMSQPLRAPLAGALLLALAACTPAPPGVDIWDPWEAENRARHEANQGVDRLIAGEGGGIAAALPAPVYLGVSNFAANAGAPSDTLNYLLQGRIGHATESTFRFILNTTLGIGGLFDFAGAIGLEGRRTDFGETLHVWGVREGAYLELPFIGPATERDAAGYAVDLLIDPLNALRPGLRGRAVGARTGARVAARIGDREAYSDFFDALIAESEDSYARARLLYLQYRRFQLEGTARIDDFDPYEEF